MGLRSLLVINEDIIQGGGGFPTHSHHDMEIITYVLEGSLEHKDSMGTGSVIQAGDVQYMAAGQGVAHSEFNHSQTEPVHLLQIWITPDSADTQSRYGQQNFTRGEKLNQLCMIAGGQAKKPALEINQDAAVYASVMEAGTSLNHSLGTGRAAWIQLVSGTIAVNGQELTAGDGLAVEDEAGIEITAIREAEFLLFDLA